MDHITIWKIYYDPYIDDIIPYGSPPKNWTLPQPIPWRPPIPSAGGQGEVHGRPVQGCDMVLTSEKKKKRLDFWAEKWAETVGRSWKILEILVLGPRFLFFSVESDVDGKL